jgi:hypothetical protein
VDGQDWAVPIKIADPGLPVISRSVRRQTIELGRDRGKSIVVASWHSRSPTRTFLLSFQLAAQELVASAHEFLAKCPGCATVFVRDDMRQTYCTARCNAASRMRKHRGRKRGQPAEPHSMPRRVIDQTVFSIGLAIDNRLAHSPTKNVDATVDLLAPRLEDRKPATRLRNRLERCCPTPEKTS